MAKLLLAILVVYAGWTLWRGPRRKPTPLRTAASAGEADARAVLGVGADAGEGEIRAAHRRLISAVHPDKGGSAELARRINAARDVLLRKA